MKIRLRIYITSGGTPSEQALEHLEAVCSEPAVRRQHDIELEILDIEDYPELARKDHVLATPTLIRKLPPPVQRVMGDLAARGDIFLALDVEDPEERRGDTGGHA